MTLPSLRTPSATDRVRQNAGSAAIAAALMIYFGFFQWTALTPAFSVFLYTLQIGGVSMAIIAAWSLVGSVTVLLVDAIASSIIGAMFIATGAAMAIDVGIGGQTLINIVCGFLFIGSGRRNWQAYAWLKGSRDDQSLREDTDRQDAAFDMGYEEQRPPPPAQSLGSQLKDRVSPLGTATVAGSALAGDTAPEDDEIGEVAMEEDAISPATPDPPTTEPDPPEGFLSSFADNDPPDTPVL